MTEDEHAKAIFAIARNNIPSSSAIANAAIATILGANIKNKDFIKSNFSSLVNDVQIEAYRAYQSSEGVACGKAIEDYFLRLLPDQPSAADVFQLMRERFLILDRFFLSLTQSRRTRAGAAFEIVVTTLFTVLEYPHTSQPEIAESRPDYILPSIDHYKKFATDCIVFTCKRTLRERWRQVITEGMTGQAFFLATIDEKLSRQELHRMKDRSVIVVVPTDLKTSNYPDQLNVIGFEDFFEHHLDPAIKRWRASKVI
jgi:EcoRII C terminal